jgi:hypothetical protein
MPKNELTLTQILGCIDKNFKSAWKEFTDEEKKCVKFWLLNRYASCVQGSRSKQENAVIKTNEIYNKNWNVLGTKHLELQWQLLCLAGNTNEVLRHEWIGFKKKEAGDTGKIEKFLKEIYPQMKLDEVELLARISTKKEIRQLARDMGYETLPF